MDDLSGGHYTALGNALVADYVFSHLQEKGLLETAEGARIGAGGRASPGGG